MAKKVNREEMVHPVIWVQEVFPVQEDFRENRARKVHREKMDHPVRREKSDRLDCKELPGCKDSKDISAHRYENSTLGNLIKFVLLGPKRITR